MRLAVNEANANVLTVILPTYNAGDHLLPAVQSVLNQTFDNFELLVLDDGSTDGTTSWINSQVHSDPRIVLIERGRHRAEASGAQVCRNLGLQMAQGQMVLFLDSDDVLAVDCLRGRLEVLEADTSLDAVVGQALHFREQPGDMGDDNIWGRWTSDETDIDRFLADDIPWQTSGPLWRREALDKVGPWDEQLQHVGHDHEFHVRALCRGIRVRKIPVVDYFWRVPRKDSLSSLQSFKCRHGDGGMITAYRQIMADVMENGVCTPPRATVMANQVIQLAVLCRNFGGWPSEAEQGVLDAHDHGILGYWKTKACRVLLRCWWRIGGVVPAMSLLSRIPANAIASR